MLSSDKLILVELHRAGSARLKKLLGGVVGGETSARLSPYSDGLAALGKPVVGYLCNPLTWYLDQWQLGCEGKGEIQKRLTDESRWDLLHSKRNNRPVKEGRKAGARPIPAHWGAAHAKTVWYAEERHPEAFREWLQAVAESRGLRRLVNHGYANSPVSRLAGLMTYQFFLMFVRNAENMEKAVDSMNALKALHTQQAITSRFIRAEAMASDLRETLEALGVALNAEQRSAIDGLKTRPGADQPAIAKYYDPASLRLVAKREAFLNELFGYALPETQTQAGDDTDLGKKKKVRPSPPEKERRRAERAERQATRAARKAAREAARSTVVAQPPAEIKPEPQRQAPPEAKAAPKPIAKKTEAKIEFEIEKPARSRPAPKIEIEIEKPAKARRARGQAASADLFDNGAEEPAAGQSPKR